MLKFIPPPQFDKPPKARHLDNWGLNRDEARLLFNNPNAILIGAIFDYQITYQRAWRAPYLLQERLGHLDIGVISRLSFEELHPCIRGRSDGEPSLHRFHSVLTRRLISMAKRLVRQYEGTAGNIWQDGAPARQVLLRLLEFDGISQKIGNMLVRLLFTYFGVRLTKWNGIDIAVDRHVERVFRRSGLVPQEGQERGSHSNRNTIIERARELVPYYPAALDEPAFEIGNRFCLANSPCCNECPLNSVCPRIDVTRVGSLGVSAATGNLSCSFSERCRVK
jgi:uncharacterized HhH-GPD family protein